MGKYGVAFEMTATVTSKKLMWTPKVPCCSFPNITLLETLFHCPTTAGVQYDRVTDQYRHSGRH